MQDSQNTSPIIWIGGKAFAADDIDFSNPGNNPELVAHLEAWMAKKEQRFARAEKRNRFHYSSSKMLRQIGKKRIRKMRFFTFVKMNTDPVPQPLQSFWEYVQHADHLPSSSDPSILALYLYKKLTPDQTRGYLLWMICYRERCLANMLTAELMQNDRRPFLDAVNSIVYMQRNDPACQEPCQPLTHYN